MSGYMCCLVSSTKFKCGYVCNWQVQDMLHRLGTIENEMHSAIQAKFDAGNIEDTEHMHAETGNEVL